MASASNSPSVPLKNWDALASALLEPANTISPALSPALHFTLSPSPGATQSSSTSESPLRVSMPRMAMPHSPVVPPSPSLPPLATAPNQHDEKSSSLPKQELSEFLRADLMVTNLKKQLALAEKAKEKSRQTLVARWKNELPIKVDLNCFTKSELEELGGPGYVSMILEDRYKKVLRSKNPTEILHPQATMQEILAHNLSRNESVFAKENPVEIADAVIYALNSPQGSEILQSWLATFRSQMPQAQTKPVVRRVRIGTKRSRSPIISEKPNKTLDNFKQEFGLI